jgi:hypothetical protein
VPIICRYSIEVIDAPDLNFEYDTSGPLHESQVIKDEQHRSYVVVSVSDEYFPDPGGSPDVAARAHGGSAEGLVSSA